MKKARIISTHHKHPDKRADLEMTDDTDAERVKLFDTPSSKSSSHEVARKLHDSSSETEDLETREIVMKNLVWMLTWKSMPLRRSHKQKWKSIGHCTLEA